MSKEKIEVREYLTEGENAEKSFRTMIEENQKAGKQCEGLVISGHHTGAFSGKRSRSSLSIRFLENLSCDPKYSSFFANVKALWLQGCRTLGVEKIAPNQFADFHTERVGQHLDADRIPLDFSQLNFGFSDILDQDNPLSSRYLRVFPLATTFGWTDTAPGEQAHSEYSIPLHIANIARINSGITADPKQLGSLSASAAGAHVNALLDLLNRRGNKCEAKSVDAWIAHGNPQQSKISLNNPLLNAYPSLITKQDPALKRANELDCILNDDCSTPEKQAKVLAALDEILSNDQNIAYTLNALFEFTKRIRQQPELADFYKTIKDKFSASTKLRNFVAIKTNSETAILRKIDLFGFAKEFFDLSQNEKAAVENQLRSSFLTLIHKQTDQGDYRAVDYQVTLFESLANHQILSGKEIEDIVTLPNIYPAVLGRIPAIVMKLGISDAEKTKVIQKILNSPKANSRTLIQITKALGTSKKPLENTDGILNQIIESDKADADTLEAIGHLSFHPKFDLELRETLLMKIVESPKTTKATSFDLAISHAESNSSDSEVMTFFQHILNSSKMESSDLSTIVQRLAPTQMEKKAGLLGGGLMSGGMGGIVLGGVGGVGGLGWPRGGFRMDGIPKKRASDLLDLIAKSPKADTGVLSAVESAKSKLKSEK